MPAFQRRVAAGLIGRKVVGSIVTGVVTGREFTQMREEFNMDMNLVAVAERDAQNAGRMLLSETPLGSAEIDGAADSAWQAYDEAAFADHVEARCDHDQSSPGDYLSCLPTAPWTQASERGAGRGRAPERMQRWVVEGGRKESGRSKSRLKVVVAYSRCRRCQHGDH